MISFFSAKSLGGRRNAGVSRKLQRWQVSPELCGREEGSEV